MVAIEQGAALAEEGRFPISRPRVWMVIAIIAVLISTGGLAARGISETSLRLGSELTWRFTCLVYFAAIVAGPLARLIPSQTLRHICEERRQLVWGFCASFVVYLAGVLMPDLLAPVHRDSLTSGTTFFVVFGAGLILVIACTASRQAALFLGETARGIILGVGLSAFWLAYALSGLSHISGPHRPDAFYGFSLCLMIVALLLRFADRFAAMIRTRGGPV